MASTDNDAYPRQPKATVIGSPLNLRLDIRIEAQGGGYSYGNLQLSESVVLGNADLL